jgi:hypothetical protein
MNFSLQAGQSAAEKSLKGSDSGRDSAVVLISAADSSGCGRCPVCGRDTEGRRVFAGSMCGRCFYAAKRRGETIPIPPCRDCGKELEKRRNSRGLCAACYQRLRRTDPDTHTRWLLSQYLWRANQRLARETTNATIAEQRDQRHAAALLAAHIRRTAV